MMTSDQIKVRVRDVMAAVFNVDAADLVDESSPDTVEGWDSVGQMNLIMALEQSFGIAFTDEQTVELRSLELIALVIADVLAARS